MQWHTILPSSPGFFSLPLPLFDLKFGAICQRPIVLEKPHPKTNTRWIMFQELHFTDQQTETGIVIQSEVKKERKTPQKVKGKSCHNTRLLHQADLLKLSCPQMQPLPVRSISNIQSIEWQDRSDITSKQLNRDPRAAREIRTIIG